MTPEEAVAAVRKADHIVIIHRGTAFFNTTDFSEAQRWQKLGATLIPHYNHDEVEHRAKKGRRTVPGWEVHLLGAVAPVYDTDADGDEVNVTNDALLAAARA